MSDETEKEPTKVTRQGLKQGMAILVRYLRKYRKETLALSALGILSAVGNGTIPYIAGRFFDAIITPSQTTLFGFALPLFAFLLIIWTIIQIITYLMDWQINIRSENFSNAVWVDYWSSGTSRLLLLPMSFHKSRKMGEVEEKINRAGFALETIIGRIVIDLAPQFLSIAIALGVGFYLKPILGLALLSGIIVYTVILYRSVSPLADIQREYQKNLFMAWGNNADVVANTQSVKQAVSEKFESDRINTILKGPVFALWNKMNRVWSNLTLAQRVIILGVQLTIFILSVYFIQAGQMTIGELLAFNAYATMVFGPFVVVGRNWQTIQNGVIQLEEAEAILSEPTENYHPSGKPEHTELRGNVTFDHVDFYYDEKSPVLKDISFKANAGEIVALVGESGVGKSTLIDLISGFHFAKKGQVLMDDKPIEKLDLISLRSQIGIVPQEVELFNDTILHNIRYGAFNATEDEAKEAARKAHAYDFIEKFPEKWQQTVGERGVKLSVGQKQRVGIARAILRNPKILILDEPTSALDAGSERAITESLESLMRGKTTFIIAHRLSTVIHADQILVFNDGSVEASGTHAELLRTSPTYARLHSLQFADDEDTAESDKDAEEF